MKFRLKALLLLLAVQFALFGRAQDMTELVNKVKTKLAQVNDYTADGILKTDVAFIKAPVSKIKMYYKKPNLFRLKKDNGISVLPKGGVSINMSNVVSISDFVALSAGHAVVDGVQTKVVKLLPTDENSEIVLSTCTSMNQIFSYARL
jgi:hypothetical protein